MGAPAQWYPDSTDPRLLRWWDGTGWTAHTRPVPEDERTRAQVAAFVPVGFEAGSRAAGSAESAESARSASTAPAPARSRRGRTWLIPVATGMVALVAGVGIGGGQSDPTESTQYEQLASTLADVEGERDALATELDIVSGDLDVAQDQIAELESSAQTAASLAERETALQTRETDVAARESAATVKETDLAQREASVTAAQDQAAAAAASQAEAPAAAAAPVPLVAAPATTDPQFATCKAAKASGYGPYRKGVDAEYDWYRDADGDGVVCES